MSEISKENISPASIDEMSYTDFVGLVNQWNVPPGSYETINEWAVFGHVDQKSNVLEAACTTGFSLRELSRLTGCSGLGIDISEKSVEAANRTKALKLPDAPIDYRFEDALLHTPEGEKYSHVVAGAALRFFPDPQEAIDHFANNLLADGGYLLTNEFFATDEVPEAIVEQSQRVFGITPTTIDYEEVMKPYAGLRRFYNATHPLRRETPEQLDHYCDSTIRRAANELQIDDTTVLSAMRKRLMTIKRASNDLRDYQGYTTLVHQYIAPEYGERYTELF